MSNISSVPRDGTMCDSMDITTTFLNALSVKTNSYYKGINILKKKKDFVISESCGSGNSDIKRRDIYFTVTTNKFKMMATLSNNNFKAKKLFNLIDDPYEQKDVLNNIVYKDDIKFLLNIIYSNRKVLFDIKGLKKSKFL